MLSHNSDGISKEHYFHRGYAKLKRMWLLLGPSGVLVMHRIWSFHEEYEEYEYKTFYLFVSLFVCEHLGQSTDKMAVLMHLNSVATVTVGW